MPGRARGHFAHDHVSADLHVVAYQVYVSSRDASYAFRLHVGVCVCACANVHVRLYAYVSDVFIEV
jgi:hypothetical protein